MIQLVLVSGGAVRIGKSIALKLATTGFSVAIQYSNSAAEAQNVVSSIKSAGGDAACFRANLENHAEVKGLIPQVNKQMGPVTCLINNASYFADDHLPDLTRASWRKHMDVNLEAPIFLAQAFAAQLPERAPGNIVNIIDQRVLHPNPHFYSYTLSKGALWFATKTMAQTLAPRIRVNAIAPGPALRNAYQTDDDFERECSGLPLGHGTSPDEIADAVVFILTTHSMTGQMLALDGGQHLVWQTPPGGAT